VFSLYTGTRQRLLAFKGPRQEIIVNKNTISISRLTSSWTASQSASKYAVSCDVEDLNNCKPRSVVPEDNEEHALYHESMALEGLACKGIIAGLHKINLVMNGRQSRDRNSKAISWFGRANFRACDHGITRGGIGVLIGGLAVVCRNVEVEWAGGLVKGSRWTVRLVLVK
ncbi:hypothetical protein Tco_0072965, partial [Tanacetum coccineum]